MTPFDKTAYCGIYCPDCIRYKNDFSACAAQLKERLAKNEFDKYAAIDTPFGANFTEYPAFSEVLTALADAQCDKPCRVGGGCSGQPCKIMECCISKNYKGCWECDAVDGCDKFDILEPRCGEMPKNNVRTISKLGVDDWVDSRDAFYVWQE